MARGFRIAIVGTGQIAAQAHLPAALASEIVEVVAFVDSVPDRAKALARSYGIDPRIVTSIDAVTEIADGALIATPNHTHRDLAVACLERGLHVLIEKPIAVDTKTGREIVNAAEEHGKVASVGYCTRFQENVQLMEALLREGYFGRISRWAYQFGSLGGWEPVSGYEMDRKLSGGGVLAVSGSHILDRILTWFGYPEESEYADDGEAGPEANAVASFRFPSEEGPIEGHVRFSKTVVLEAGIVMETMRGHVALAEGRDTPILLRPDESPDLELVVRRRRGKAVPKRSVFQLQLEDFVEACRGEHPPMVSAPQGLETTRLIEELYARRKGLEADFYPTRSAVVGS